jgi:LPXTG-motif cell wall-anchored protein
MLVRVADSLPVVAAEDIVDGPRIDADVVEARVGGFEARETVYGAIGPEIISAVTAQADESGVVEMRLPVREARSAGAELILYAPVSGRGGRIPLTVEPAATIELPATGFDPTWSLIAALAVAIGLTLTLRRRIL